MIRLIKPWLVHADVIEMCKQKLPAFQRDFEQLINDPASVMDEGEEMSTSEMLSIMKEHDLEFEDIYRAFFDQVEEYDVTDFVDIKQTAKPNEIELSWRKPK